MSYLARAIQRDNPPARSIRKRVRAPAAPVPSLIRTCNGRRRSSAKAEGIHPIQYAYFRVAQLPTCAGNFRLRDGFASKVVAGETKLVELRSSVLAKPKARLSSIGSAMTCLTQQRRRRSQISAQSCALATLSPLTYVFATLKELPRVSRSQTVATPLELRANIATLTHGFKANPGL